MSVKVVNNKIVVSLSGASKKITLVGTQGPPGASFPAGGTTNQVLAKLSNTTGHVGWVNQTGAVSSVNGKTGTVVLVKADVGLGNVDNTADASKPVSAAQAAADAATLASANATTAAHSGRTDNPHSVTAAQVGLGNVENKSSATIRGEITSGNVAAALGYTPENAAQKGVAGGYTPLDGANKVPGTHMPSTDAVPEGASNLYFTAARVLTTVLSGLSTATNAVITAADTVLTALGKLQKQVTDNLATLTSHTGAAAPHTGHVAKAGDTLTGALNWATTQTIASAATTDIGAATSNSVIVSGTTTITGLGTIAAGAERVVQFSGALTLTHNATSLILPGGANITTAAGDVAYFVSLGAGNWCCTGYQKANGQAVVASGALTNFAEAVNTAAPNATVPVVSLTATNAATNVDIALVPKGTGAIVVQVADGTTTGGNKRGAGAVDLQIIRSNPAEVASGAYSFIAGRYNKVSGPSSAAIGEAHYVSGPVCFAGGFRNTVSSVGGYGCAFGYQNTVSGTASMTIGSNNTADADNSIATGWYATSRGIASTMQHAGSRRAADGDRQFRHIPQSTVTSNATATVLTSNGAAGSTGNTWVLPANYSGIMHGFVIARNTANNDSIGWEIKAMVSRDSTAASVAILGSASVVGVGTADVSMTSCGLAVGANTTNGSITITATGLAATTIAWNGYLHCIKNG